MIQSFFFAKVLTREISKEYNLKNLGDWVKFTKSPEFNEFRGVIPVNPALYYSKANVIKRRRILLNKITKVQSSNGGKGIFKNPLNLGANGGASCL